MKTMLSAIASSIVCIAAIAAPAPANASCPGGGGSVVACCIYNCYQDFSWPLNHACALSCGIMDVIVGNHYDPQGVAPAFAEAVVLDGPHGHSLVLAPTAANRTQVLLEAGSYAMSTDNFEQDTRVDKVVFSFVSGDDYLRDFEDGPSWNTIGQATWTSSSRTWRLLWNASQLPSGDYLLRAVFTEGSQIRDAVIPVHVP